jgi:hypothetical protein
LFTTLPVLLQGREILSLRLGKRIGGVFDKSMLQIFGLKSEEAAADSKSAAYCGAARFLLFIKYY